MHANWIASVSNVFLREGGGGEDRANPPPPYIEEAEEA